jgi:uncharacterized membrane protein
MSESTALSTNADAPVDVTRTIARLAPLDALRGLIIIVMALDHANAFIAHEHPRPEMWFGSFPTYTDPLPFFTRAVTHLAAPGFFFLMGAGMVLFGVSRGKLGWTGGRIRGQLVVRGAILILLQLFVEDPAWIWGNGGPFILRAQPIYLGVLYGLGGAMLLGAFLLWAGPRLLLALSVFLLVGTELAIRLFAAELLQFAPLTQMFLLPGGTQTIDVLYPILPWLGVTTFGMAFGKWFSENPTQAYRRALYFGLAFLALYIPLRALNGFGNIRAQVGTGWIAFLNNVKYPPSITFLLLALGVDLSLLFAFSRRALSFLLLPLSPLIVFGITPLFFYIAHLYLYGYMGRTFFSEGTGIPRMFLWWLVGLGILYPCCLLYGWFKESRPPYSIWRFF